MALHLHLWGVGYARAFASLSFDVYSIGKCIVAYQKCDRYVVEALLRSKDGIIWDTTARR